LQLKRKPPSKPNTGKEDKVNLCNVEVSDVGLIVYLKGFGLKVPKMKRLAFMQQMF
jgi:hypothetical protein